jgi:uncharacterized protein
MNIINQTKNYVENQLKDDASGHDWWHIFRVWNLAKQISKKYPDSDHQVIELSALLHDIADWKTNGGDFSEGAKVSREWLSQFESLSNSQINHICEIVENISFKGVNSKIIELSLEGQIVQDADRLDAMGAMGVTRTFAYGGHKGQLIYHPDIKPIDHEDENSYVQSKQPSTSVNHFYEKLFHLKDRMNTLEGKRIANNRHQFMEQFLEQFYKEWNSER